MIRLSFLPSRPYKNFDRFLFEQQRKSYNKKVLYPCLCCGGSGRIIAPYEQPDPIEGYKMADRVNCPDCIQGGTTKEVYQKYYKEAVDDWKKRFKLAKQQLDFQKSGLNKIKQYLTKEEIKALELHEIIFTKG